MNISNQNDILRLKALMSLLDEITKLNSKIENKVFEDENFRKKLVDEIKKSKISLKESSADIKIKPLQSKIRNSDIPFVRPKKRNVFNEYETDKIFEDFNRWRLDDYADIKKGKEEKVESCIPQKKKNKKSEEKLSQITSKFSALNMLKYSFVALPFLSAIAPEIEKLENLFRGNESPLEKFKSEKTDVTKKDLEIKSKNEFNISNQKINNLEDLKLYSQKTADVGSKEYNLSKTDEIISVSQNQTSKINYNNQKLDEIKLSVNSGKNNDYIIGKLQIESDTGKINLNTFKKIEFSITPNRNGEYSKENMLKIEQEIYSKENMIYSGTLSFTISDFHDLFYGKIKNKIETYVAFGNMKQWKSDVKEVKDEIISILGKTSYEKQIVSSLFDKYISEINLNNSNDFSVESNQNFINEITNVTSKGFDSNFKLVESEYEELKYKSNFKNKKINLKVFDDHDIVNVSMVLKAYYLWEKSVIGLYYKWAFTKKERQQKLEKEFDKFWKHIYVKFKIKRSDDIFTMIYYDNFDKLKKNFDKNDKNSISEDVFEGVTSYSKNVFKVKKDYNLNLQLYKKPINNFMGGMIGVGQSFGGNISDPEGKTLKMNQNVLSNFKALSTDPETLKITNNNKIPINSAYRDYNDQIRLWNLNVANGNFYATLPFISPHSFGIALDVNGNIVNQLKSKGLLEKYGFIQDSKEDWHIQDKHLTKQYFDEISTTYSKVLSLNSYIKSHKDEAFFIPSGLSEAEVLQYLNSKYDELISKKSSNNTTTSTSSETKTYTNTEIQNMYSTTPDTLNIEEYINEFEEIEFNEEKSFNF